MEGTTEPVVLTGADRRILRRLAHSLKPVVQMGSSGLTESLVGAVDRALADHELVKIRIADEREARRAVAEQLARRTGSALAGSVGHVAILYRPAAERERRVIVLPSRDAEADETSDPPPRARHTPQAARRRAPEPIARSIAAIAWVGVMSIGPVDRNKIIKVLVASVLVAAAFVAMRRALGLELAPESLRGAVKEAGVWAPLVYVGIVAFRVPLGLPSQLVLVGGGLVFGTVAGTVYGAIGLLASALALFAGARWAGREAVEARVPDRLRPLLDVASSRVGVIFMALGTGYPLGPITVYHLIGGVTAMPFPLFAISVALGSVIRAAIFTFFGSSLVSGQIGTLLWATVILVLAVLLPLVFPRSRAWLLQAIGNGVAPRA